MHVIIIIITSNIIITQYHQPQYHHIYFVLEYILTQITHIHVHRKKKCNSEEYHENTQRSKSETYIHSVHKKSSIILIRVV